MSRKNNDDWIQMKPYQRFKYRLSGIVVTPIEDYKRAYQQSKKQKKVCLTTYLLFRF